MTALPGRRRRSTIIAASVAATAVVVTGGLTVAGALTLYNSTDGNNAAPTIPEINFPYTPTGLLAVVDDDGNLASMTVAVLSPGNGPGGNVVAVPVSADASNGEGDQRLPIAETVTLDGADAVRDEVELTMNLTFDSVEVVDEARLAELLEPVGEVTVELPMDVVDAAGDVVAERGESTLDASDLAAVLAARDLETPAVDQLPVAAAVWDAIAATVGDGVGAPTPVASGARLPVPADDLTPLLSQVLAGPVGSYALHTKPLNDEPADDLDVAQLDQVEVTLVFAQLAPARVSSVNPHLAMQINVNFSEEQLASRGLTNSDVAYEAVAQMVFLRANVLSVDTTPGEAPTATQVAPRDPSVNTEGADEVLGPIEVVVADEHIANVDAVVTLGTDYLDFLDANRPRTDPGAEPTTSDPATDTTESESDATERDDTSDTGGVDTTEPTGFATTDTSGEDDDATDR